MGHFSEWCTGSQSEAKKLLLIKGKHAYKKSGVSPDRFEFHFIQSLIDSALALLTPPSHPFTNMACASALYKVRCGLEGIMKNVIVVIRCMTNKN